MLFQICSPKPSVHTASIKCPLSDTLHNYSHHHKTSINTALGNSLHFRLSIIAHSITLSLQPKQFFTALNGRSRTGTDYA